MMRKKLKGFTGILLGLLLVLFCPSFVRAEEETAYAATWEDGADGRFIASYDELRLGDVYRRCPYVEKALSFYWTSDLSTEDPVPDETVSVTVEAVSSEDSAFVTQAEGNVLRVTPDAEVLEMLPDGSQEENLTVRLSIGGYETAERRAEIVLPVTMQVTVGDPVFEIGNAEELRHFADLTREGYLDISAVLTDDIVINKSVLQDGRLTEETGSLTSWTPIGTQEAPFTGTFDGDGHTIRGLYVESNDLGGLFGALSGTVKNVRLEDAWIRGNAAAGAAAAWNSGSIRNVSTDAVVGAYGLAGGLAGVNEGEIKRCFTTGSAGILIPAETGLGAADTDDTEENEDVPQGDEGATDEALALPAGDAGISGPVAATDSGSIEKVYYLSGEEVDGIDGTMAVSSESLSSGEVCWMLNEGLEAPVFFQNLSENADPEPTLSGTHGIVYHGFLDCAGTSVYSNEALPQSLPAHQLEMIGIKEANCTEPGNIVYWKCSVCGKCFSDEAGRDQVGENYWTIPAYGHRMTGHPAVEANCLTEGSTAYWQCNVCGKYYGDAEGTTEIEEGSWVIPAGTHKLILHEEKAPACEEEGNRAYWQCGVCGRYFADEAAGTEIEERSWVIAPLGHSLTAHAAKEPTCTEEGNTAYWQCTVCGKYFADEDGSEVLSENAWILPKKAHTLTAYEAIPATCTEEGRSAYWVCDVCGQYFEDAAGMSRIEENAWITVPLGHSLTAHAAKEPTCTEEGNTAYWQCETCGTYFSDEAGTEEIEKDSWILAPKGHVLSAHEGKDATCTEEGSLAYWSCAVCGKYYADAEAEEELSEYAWILPKKAHTLTEHEAVPATCTEEGQRAYWTCDVCGHFFADADGKEEIEENTWITAPLGHSLTSHAAKEATCFQEGNTAYWACETCGKYFGDAEGETEIEEDSWLIEKTAHTLTAHEAKDPTCTEAGRHLYWSCDVCGQAFDDAEGTKPLEKDAWVIPAAGHQMTSHASKNATCTEDGSAAYWSCETCGKYFNDEDGSFEIVENSWVVPAYGHTLTAHKAVEATCTKDGSAAYWSCSVCGGFFLDAKGTVAVEEDSWILPAAGHDFVDGICTRCGEKEKKETEPESESESETEPETKPTEPEIKPVPVTVPESETEAPTAPVEYMISVSNDGHGKASASPEFAATGMTVTLTAVPDTGYRFKEWQVLYGGVKISGNKFTVGTDNVEIKAFFEKVPDAPPSIVAGNGAGWTEGSKKGLTITCDGDFFSFTGLKVDGSEIAQKNYSASAGSTVVELKPEFLNTLAVGEHKVTFLYGSLESDAARFTVYAKEAAPASGLKVILWIIAAAAAAGIIATGYIMISRKKKPEN